MLILSQIGLLLAVVPCYWMLLNAYRRQDAQQSAFLLSILLCLAGCLVPDAVVLLPVSLLLFQMLRAASLRLYMAALIGIAASVIYLLLTWFLTPGSAAVEWVQSNWHDAFERTYAWEVWPLWLTVLSAVLVLIGLWAQLAHWGQYNRANVRIQTRLLLVSPFYWLSLLSSLFPAMSGSCMLTVLWATSLYFPVLYVITYGWPKMPTRAKSDPYRRSYSRRSRKRK